MASAVSSIYEYPISAASAAYAPTNTSEVTGMIDSAVSGKLDASASSAFITSTAGCQPAGDYVSSSELADYQTTAGMSAYATTDELSAKLDASASSSFITSTANCQPSGDYVSSSDLAGYLPTSSIGVDSASAVTSIAGSSIAGGGGVVTATGTATAGDTAEPTTYVTSIDGMALSAANDTVLTAAYRVTSYDPELSASSTSTATGTATGFGVVNQDNAVAFSTASRVSSVKMNDGTELDIMANQLAAGTWQTGGKGNASYPYFWLSFSPASNAFPGSATTGYLSPCQYATGAGIMMSAGYFRGMLKANELFLSREMGLDMSTATNSFSGYYLRAEGHNQRGAHVGLTATRSPGGAYTGDSSECWTSIADFKQSGIFFNYTSTRESSASARNNYNASITTASIGLSAAYPTASSQESMVLGRSAITFTANDSSESGTGSASTTYAYTGITFEDSASTATMEKSSIGYWDAKLDSSASSSFATTAELADKLDASASSSFITSIAGLATTGDLENYQPTSSMGDYQTTAGMSAYATTGDLSGKLDASASSAFITSTAGLATTGDLENYQPTSSMGEYATTAELSGKLDSSASSAFITSTAGCQPAGDYVSSSELADYQTTAGMSAYATTGDLSGKLDSSASSAFITSTAGLATTADLSTKLDASAEVVTSLAIQWDDDTALINGINGSHIVAISAAYAPTNTADVTAMIDSAVSGKMDTSASSAFITSTAGCQPAGDYVSSSELAAYQTTAGMSGYATTADLSAKLDASASSSFITSTAGLATTGDLAAKLDVTASSSFITSTSDCMPLSSSSEFYSTSNPAGYITGVDLTPYQTTAGMSGYLATSSIGVDTASAITSIAGSAIAGGGGDADWSAESGQPGYIENKPVPKTLTAGTGISITENQSTITIANTAPDTVASLPTNLTAAQIQAFKEALGVDETLLWSGVALDATMSELPTNFERIRIEFGTPVANTGDNIGRGCIEVSMAYVDTSNNGSIFLSTFFNGDGSNNTPYYTSGFVIGIRTLSWQTAWTAFGQVFGTTKSTGNSWFRLNKVVGIHRIASN